MDRRMEITKHINKDKKGIEIGPWFAPLAPKREGFNCLSFDVFDTETLKKNAEQDPHTDNSCIATIEAVDIVGNSTEIEHVIAARGELGTFDYIISSHNFEHLPNPIRFLQGCEKVLKPGGYLSMAIPDKRSCFDYFKPISTLGNWLEAYFQNRDRPTLAQIFDQNSLHSRYSDVDVQRTGFFIENDPSNVSVLNTLKDAYDSYVEQNTNKNREYHDVHCWAFTPSSLHLLFLDIGFLRLTQLSVKELSNACGNEILVHLHNSSPGFLEPKAFYNERQTLLHAAMNESAFNSVYAYMLKHARGSTNDELRSEVTKFQNELIFLRSELIRTREQSDFYEAQVGEIKRTMAWKAIAPFWRLETRGHRRYKRQG